MPDVLLDELARGAADLVRGALGGHEIRQVWTDHDRILFLLSDGRTGDIELLVNWDVGATRDQGTRGEAWSAPAGS